MRAFDATQLDYLATAERLALVEHREESCLIHQRVSEDVVATGLEEGDRPDGPRERDRTRMVGRE